MGVAAAWALIAAVVGGWLLARCRRREHEDAAQTERVMESLKPDRSHLHEMDAL